MEFPTKQINWDKIYSDHKQLEAKMFDLVKRTKHDF